MKTLPLTAMLALVSTSAWASATYPPAMKQHLKLDDAPECTLCHSSNTGGEGTAITPFAASVKSLGLTGGSNTTKLKDVLGKLESDSVDTDGDGVGDLAEIRDGSDPSKKDREPPVGQSQDPVATPGDGAGTEEPTTGCSAGGVGGLGALALALFAFLRRAKTEEA